MPFVHESRWDRARFVSDVQKPGTAQIANFDVRAVWTLENLGLAADYVRTNTDLATMESANEAARRAVNGVLAASGVAARPCQVWELVEPAAFKVPQALDRQRLARGLPHALAPLVHGGGDLGAIPAALGRSAA